MSDLSGKTVAIIATDFFEEPELVQPRDALRDAGATVRIYSSSTDPIQAVQGDTDPTQKVDVDGTFEDLDPGAIDALVVPGRTVNADRIRTNIFAGGMVESRAAARGISVDEYFRSNLLGREVTARDVAESFAWLAQARATTGCVVTVDGGNAAAFPR